MIGSHPPMEVFRDIPVVPTQSIKDRVPRGGPVWPNFARQTGVRVCRSGVPADRRPDMPAEPGARIGAPCVWGGYLEASFGHLVAEHIPRLPFALAERPDDLYLFTCARGKGRSDIPAVVWDLLAWFGLPQDRALVVESPVTAAELRAGPQAECLWRSTPAPAYLAELDRVADRNGLIPRPAPVLYVSREGILARGGGGHLGETYLVARLRALGVAVMDPAACSVREQLAAYAGAERIVFAEGSARCRRLVYHDTVGDRVLTYPSGGAPRTDTAAILYDRDRLFDAFAEVGVDLARVWDDDAWRAAAAGDLAVWMARHPPAALRPIEVIEALAWAGIPLPEGAIDLTTLT
ncbi:MAG: glycosyltransferase family 61 protein [Rhodobacteraceae bacterium]|nr:glycosyltransferase family 61 protein [Paracoccaceae bacterium]